MTYIGILFTIACILSVVGLIYSHILYLKLKYTEPGSSRTYSAKKDIVHFTFSPFYGLLIIWIITMLIVCVFFGSTVTNIHTRTIVNSDEQVVIFEEQTKEHCIASIDGKQYICTRVVINDDIQKVCVVFNDDERADNFINNFFLYEFVVLEDTYELHIPASYLESS